LGVVAIAQGELGVVEIDRRRAREDHVADRLGGPDYAATPTFEVRASDRRAAAIEHERRAAKASIVELGSAEAAVELDVVEPERRVRGA